MHTFLVVLHVSTMILSLLGMGAAIVLGLAGRTAAAQFASFSMALTLVGCGAGAVLLFDTPLSLRCALLTVYLFAMTAVFVFGFSKGSAERARFIRRPASIQKS